jgi:predicted amidophosphoribosyltransferase
MLESRNAAIPNSTVVLLCPNCQKRLPLSGRLSMRGTTGIYCRHCRRTVQVTMDVADDVAHDQDE